MQALYRPSLVQRIAGWWRVFRYGLPPEFDPVEYLRLNPDVALANIDPVRHFLEFGRMEGRRWKFDLPPDFDANEYLHLNPDVAAAKVDPVQHFLQFGRNEGRVWKRVPSTAISNWKPDAPGARLTHDFRWVGGSFTSKPVTVGSHGKINIILHQYKFWAAPQALGPINLDDEAARSHPKIISAESRDELIALLGEPAVEGGSAANDDSKNEIAVTPRPADTSLPIPVDTSLPINVPDALHKYAKALGTRKLLSVVTPYFRKDPTVFRDLEALRGIMAGPQTQLTASRSEFTAERRPTASTDRRSPSTALSPLPDLSSPGGIANAKMLQVNNPWMPRNEVAEHKFAKVIGARKLISVVIPYFCKDSTIFQCLEALRNQEYALCSRDDIEIIIVDDGSPGESIHERLPEDVHYIWQKKIQYGICRAKNTGAKLCNGRYIVFVDPDLKVGRHYFDSILRYFSKFGDRVVQAGYIFGYYFDGSPDPRTEFGVWENPGIQSRRFYQVAGGNLAIAHDLFNESPGFDEDLIYGGVEDLLFGYHLSLLPGTAVVFNREMEVHHIPHPIGGAHLNVNRTWEIVKHKWPEFYRDYRENGSR